MVEAPKIHVEYYIFIGSGTHAEAVKFKEIKCSTRVWMEVLKCGEGNAGDTPGNVKAIVAVVFKISDQCVIYLFILVWMEVLECGDNAGDTPGNVKAIMAVVFKISNQCVIYLFF